MVKCRDMETKDLLLKEYDSAWQHLILAKESKQKTIRLFLAIVATIIAFVIKGDLPLKTLIYLPLIELTFLIYLLHQIFYQSCASNAFHVVEEKINQHISSSEFSYKFDLIKRIRYLRDGDRLYIMGLIARITIITALLVSSILSLHVGLSEYKICGWEYWFFMSINLFAILIVGITHHFEVQGRKRRHKEIVASVLGFSNSNT